MARELTIEIRAESQQAEDAFARVEDRLKGVEQTADKAGDRVDDFGESAGGAAKEATTFSRALEKIGGPVGVAALAGAGLAIATKYAVDFTSNIAKAARNAEISTDAMQGLDAVARKNGSTFDVLSKAMFDLDVKLSKGGKNVIGIVEGMGESVDDLLKLSRDERFRAVATAIANIEDPAERARAAVELLGGQAQDLMPIMRDLADGADQNMPRVSAAFVRAGDDIGRAWSSMIDTLITRGSQFLSYLLLWPVALSNWAQDVSSAIHGATGAIPALPGRPESPLLAAPSTAFDPLNGQSMAFVERQLTQGIRTPGRSARGGGASVLPFVRPNLMGELQGYNILQAQMFNGMGFPGFTGGFGSTASNGVGLGFPGWALAPLAAQQNLNFAPFAGTVPMNAPGLSGGGFANFFRGTGGRLAGMGAGMLTGLIPGLSGLGSSIGSTVGAGLSGIGSIAGSLGGALGPMLGPIAGLVGGLFGKLFHNEGKQTNRTRDSFIQDNFGSVDALREAAEKAGFSVDRMLSVKKVKDFEAEVQKLNKAMSEQEQDAQRVGEAMDRWGLTIEEMGPKFQQTRLNDIFKEALEDMRVLTNAGADFNTVAEKMAPSFGALIQEAIESGTQVPRELEPILKKMIEMGILVDKNGDKFTDLSQIPFAQNLNKDFQTLIEKMDALISRISELPGLFDDATDAANELADAAPGGDMPTRPDTSESAPGFDLGGVAGRDWRQRSLRDTIPAWLRPGEVALTPEQARGGVSVQINGLTVGGGMGRAETAEQVGKAVVAYMERRGVRFGRRVA